MDLLSLWDFSDPSASEQRFRNELEGASFDERLILKTQIARTYGLRKDFATAHQILDEVQNELGSASDEARVRYELERGRALCSPVHPPETQTQDTRARAAQHFLAAFDLAKQANLEYLAVDAIHMMAMVEENPEKQLEWDLRSLAYLETCHQEEAKKWEATLRNNVGHGLSALGRYEEALDQFEAALALRESEGNLKTIKAGKWMVAHTLRLMGRLAEALQIQSALEHVGDPSPYVYDELEILYRSTGDEEKALEYAQKKAAL